MIKIGLTGSIAMGKSEVARIFREEGVPVFDSDAEVHKLYESAEGVSLLKPHVPNAIAKNKIDRGLLTKVVMADPAKLNALENIVHAEIARRREIFADEAETQGHPIIVFDVPLLFEKNVENTVDVTVVVSSPEAAQRQRALARPGMTPPKLEMILTRQMADSEKRKRADHILENNGTLADLKSATLNLIRSIKRTHSL